MPGVPGPQAGARPRSAPAASATAATARAPSARTSARRPAARRARDRLDLHPAEAELRPRAQMRRPLAAPEPGPLPHQAPDADSLLRVSARGVQLGEAEQMAELVAEDPEGAERADLLLRDHARRLVGHPARARRRHERRV